jgi:hypothetical protein
MKGFLSRPKQNTSTGAQRVLIATSLIIGLTVNGCASFEPGLRLQDMHRPRQPSAKAVQEGVEVSVEEFVTSSKSQMMFDTDLASEGVIPLFIRVDNNGTKRYSARRVDIKASSNGQSLISLAPREAANMAATSEYAGKALGWTLAAGPFAILLWPVTIGASAVHTHGINRRIEAFFDASSYQDALLSPKQSTLGFVFFKAPEGVKQLDNFVVEAEVIEDANEAKLPYIFKLPPLLISQ